MKRLLFVLCAFAPLVGASPPAFALGSPPPPQPQKHVLQEKEAKELWAFRESIALGVAEEDLAELVADCRASGFTMGEIQRILALVAKVKLAGLPHRQLFEKLREGLVKGAQPELIDAALAGKATTLRKAKTVVDDLLLEGHAVKDYNLAIEVVADALDVGMSPQQIRVMVQKGKSPAQGLPDPSKLFWKVVPPQ